MPEPRRRQVPRSAPFEPRERRLASRRGIGEIARHVHGEAAFRADPPERSKRVHVRRFERDDTLELSCRCDLAAVEWIERIAPRELPYRARRGIRERDRRGIERPGDGKADSGG